MPLDLTKENPLPRKIKAAFFDLDGTVINTSDSIGPDVRSALDTLRRNNIAVAIASGRAAFAASHIIKELNITSPSMFFSGALVVDPVNGQELLKVGLSKDEARSVMSLAIKHNICCETYTSKEFYISAPHPVAEVHGTFLKRSPKVRPFEDVLAEEEVLKLLLAAEKKSGEDIIRGIMRDLPEIHFGPASIAARPDLMFCNVTTPRASKDNCFKLMCELSGASREETIAFGDGESDIRFLELAGIGVAMANAPSRVKEAADYVTRHVDEDGVPFALQKFIPDIW